MFILRSLTRRTKTDRAAFIKVRYDSGCDIAAAVFVATELNEIVQENP